MAIRVGRWDCDACGTKGILGPETSCPNCGSPRPKDVRFYLPEGAEEVSDEERLEEARAGADWKCGHCGAQNKASETACRSCGNPRDEDSDDTELQQREYRSGEVPRESFEKVRTRHPDEPPKTGKSKTGRLVGLLFLILVVVGGGFLLLRLFPRTVEVEVKGFAWERTLQMLHHEAVTHEDWETPNGAFDVESFKAVHHYNKVLKGYRTVTKSEKVQVGTERYVCGQRDLGNGYFEDVYCDRPVYETRQREVEEPVYEQVPVYQTKYRYKLMEWVPKKGGLLKASGNNHQPYWPEPPPNLPDRANWRKGPTTENYFVRVEAPDGEVHQEEVKAGTWHRVEEGSILKGREIWLIGTWLGLMDE